ncbi:hypothetical protein DMA11_23685 [Marinilabiliaceae bacterium JC017]|nr:hypothetical protein DMA11_23685 [Marinilabiliaceae bacterium JC017]
MISQPGTQNHQPKTQNPKLSTTLQPIASSFYTLPSNPKDDTPVQRNISLHYQLTKYYNDHIPGFK